MTYSIIESGNKQYSVKAGDIIDIELTYGKDNEKLSFDKVLLVSNGADIKIGQPYIAGAKVLGKILSTVKDDKVTTFKYKNKTNYRRTKGHRQNYTRVQIEEIKA